MAERSERDAWYSLDEDDNDSARFFAYIAASLRTVEPDSISTLESTLEAGSANPRELAAALINLRCGISKGCTKKVC